MSKNYNVRFQPGQNPAVVECFNIVPNGDCFYLSVIRAISLSQSALSTGLTVQKLRYSVQHKLAERDWSDIVLSIISDFDNADDVQKRIGELPGYRGIFKQVVNNIFATYVARGCDTIARQQAEHTLLSLGERGKLTYLDMVANSQAWARALEIQNLAELMNLVIVRIDKPYPILPDSILEARLQTYTAVVPGKLIVPMLCDAGDTHFDVFNPRPFHEAKGIDVVAYVILDDVIKEAPLLIDPSQIIITIPRYVPSPVLTPAKAKRDKPLTFHDLGRLADDYVRYNMLPDLTLDENLELMERVLSHDLSPEFALEWISMLAGDMHKNHRAEANNHKGVNWLKLSHLAVGLAYDGKLYTAVPKIKDIAFSSELIKFELAELLNAVKLIRRNPIYHQARPITNGLSALSEFLIDGDRFQSLGNEIIQADLATYSHLTSKKNSQSVVFSLVTIFRIAEGILNLSEMSRSFFPKELLARLGEMRNIICHPEKSASWKEVEEVLSSGKSAKINLEYFASNLRQILESFSLARKYYNTIAAKTREHVQDKQIDGVLRYYFSKKVVDEFENRVFQFAQRNNILQFDRDSKSWFVSPSTIWKEVVCGISLPDKVVIMDDKAILRSLLDHYRTKEEETREELQKLGDYLEEHREYGVKGHAYKKEYDELRGCFARMSLALSLYQPHLSREDMKKAADLVKSKPKQDELVEKIPPRVTNFYLLKEWRAIFRCLVSKAILATEQHLAKQEASLDGWREHYLFAQEMGLVFGIHTERVFHNSKKGGLYEKGILTDYPSLQRDYLSNIKKRELLVQRYNAEEQRQQIMHRYLESKHLADIFAKVIFCLEQVIEVYDRYIKHPSPKTVMESSLIVYQANLEFYIMLAGSLIRACKENPSNCGINITFSQLTDYVIAKEKDKESTLRDKLDYMQMLRGQAAHIHTPAAGIVDAYRACWNFHGESYVAAKLCVPHLQTLFEVLTKFVKANSNVVEIRNDHVHTHRLDRRAPLPEILGDIRGAAHDHAVRALPDTKWRDHITASSAASGAALPPSQ